MSGGQAHIPKRSVSMEGLRSSGTTYGWRLASCGEPKGPESCGLTIYVLIKKARTREIIKFEKWGKYMAVLALS